MNNFAKYYQLQVPLRNLVQLVVVELDAEAEELERIKRILVALAPLEHIIRNLKTEGVEVAVTFTDTRNNQLLEEELNDRSKGN